MKLDPVTLALVQNRLDHICQQMGWVMTRTARSPIFSHAHDFSCFITDAEGTIIAQADGIPIHTGGGGFAVRALLDAFSKDDIADGDVFVLSDPYVAGGNHLPDWVIARPVFFEDRIVAFTCNRAHQSDIGGGAAGTYNPEATEIFHEGIRLPVLRLVRQGEILDDLWQLLMINTRTPHYLDGDLRAMLGSTRIGADHMIELFVKLGVEEGLTYFEGILTHADNRLRAAIGGLPDGVYQGADWFDNDCFETVDIPICVTITVSGEEVTVDFTGTSPQIKGFKNSSIANTYSAVYVALSSFFDPTIPRNEGTYRGVTIIAPEGSLVNPRPPAPMTMNTVFPGCQIIHACWQALGQADPEQSCAGWGHNSFPISSGFQSNGDRFVMYHWAGASGGGAVDGRDGFPQQGGLNSLCGLVVPNVETFEQLFPVDIIRHEIRCDSGGAGEFRGGPGVHYEVDLQTPVQMAFRGEGSSKFPAYGAGGGQPGGVGEMTVHTEDGETFTPPAYGIRHIGPSRFAMASPGGGGWGDPLRRDVNAVLRDVHDGVVDRATASDIYGVQLTEDGKGVDLEATDRRRVELAPVA